MFIAKTITMIIGACLIILVGENIKQKYKKNYLRILNLIELLKIVRNEINFNKSYFKEIIQLHLSEYDDDFIEPFVKFISNNSIKITWFDKEENNLIENFINSIGENNLEIEMLKFDQILITLNEISEKYKKILTTNGALANKLSVCCSLVFLILFA